MKIIIDNKQQEIFEADKLSFVFRSKNYSPIVSIQSDEGLMTGAISVVCQESVNLIAHYENININYGLTEKYINLLSKARENGYDYYLIDTSGLDYNGLEKLIQYVSEYSIKGILFLNWKDLDTLFSVNKCFVVKQDEISLLNKGKRFIINTD